MHLLRTTEVMESLKPKLTIKINEPNLNQNIIIGARGACHI